MLFIMPVLRLLAVSALYYVAKGASSAGRLGALRGGHVGESHHIGVDAAEANGVALDADFDAFLSEWFAEFMERRPLDALNFGLKLRNCGAEMPKRPVWGNVSAAGEAEELRQDLQRLAEMERRFGASVGQRDVADERYVSYLVMKQKVEEMRMEHQHRDFRLPFGPLGCRIGIMGCQKRVLHAIQGLPLASVEDANCYVALLRGLPAFFEAHIGNLRDAAANGMYPYRNIVEGVISDCSDQLPSTVDSAFMAGDPRESELFQTFATKLQTARDVPNASKAQLLRDAERGVTDGLWPAFRNLRQFAESTLLPSAPDSHGGLFSTYGQRGADFYTYRVQLLGVGHNASSLHRLALELVDTNERKMRRLAKEGLDEEGHRLRIPESDFTVVLKALQSKYYANTYADSEVGRSSYLSDMRGYITSMWARLRQHNNGSQPLFFDADVPKQQCNVERIASKNFPALAQYRPGSLVDSGKPSVVAFNVNNMSFLPKAEMEATAYHEVVPGHHLQTMRSLSLRRELPDFRRYFGDEAFAEGWAVYAEQELAPRLKNLSVSSKIGLLNFRQYRAIRLAVDTGIHTEGWDFARAKDFYLKHSIISPERAEQSVRRHYAWPAQQLAYAVGHENFLGLHAKAMSIPCPRNCSEPSFHKALLSHGDLPLTLVERVVLAEFRKRCSMASLATSGSCE